MKRLLFFLCFLILSLSLLLVGCENPGVGTTNETTTPATSSIPKTAGNIVSPTNNFHEYALPQSNSGLMRPAIDPQGRIWFGEMNRNHLTVFDPATHTFRQMVPPDGQYGIMGIAAATDGSIWFAEQSADYIGHYMTGTGQYHLYPLPTLTKPDPGDARKTISLPSAPNDIALDPSGNVWFTEQNADAVGMLNPSTGSIKQYSLESRKSTPSLTPYGITVDRQGVVWFTETSTGRVGRLDPGTGSIRYYTPPGPAQPLMEIGADSRGTLWITSFSDGLLLSLNPHTGTWTDYYASLNGKNTGGIYGLLIGPNDDVWITVSNQNALAHLDRAKHQFVYYPLPVPSSVPFGVVMDAHHMLWFTEAGTDKIGMLQP